MKDILKNLENWHVQTLFLLSYCRNSANFVQFWHYKQSFVDEVLTESSDGQNGDKKCQIQPPLPSLTKGRHHRQQHRSQSKPY